MPKDIFGFAGNQEKGTYGLGLKLTLTRNVDNSVLNKANATIVGKNKIKAIEWYVAHCTSSIPQQAILSKKFLNKTSTELQYVKISVFMKEVKTHNLWTFELRTQEGINIPLWIIVGFQQRDRHNQIYLQEQALNALLVEKSILIQLFF